MRVAVVGGGVSGLACAYRLVRGGAVPIVFEKGARAGGWVGTEEVDGFLCERGPAALRGPGPEEGLLHDLALLDDRVPASPAARTRYLVRGGRLVSAPGGPRDLLTTPLLSPAGRLRLLVEPLIRRGRPGGEETVRAFLRRRFGPDAARLADPIVAGIFAGDADRLSVRAAFPALARWEAEAGSVLLGAVRSGRAGVGLYSFAEGLRRLPSTLAASLPGRLRLSAPVTCLFREGDGWNVEGERFDAVVLALPAHAAAGLVEETDAELAARLAAIPFAGVVVASLAYPRGAFARPPEGFGYLVPRGEGARALGCLFESSLFPHLAPPGQVLLRVLAGGVRDPGAVSEDPGTLACWMAAEVESLLGAAGPGRLLRLDRYPRCLPQYEIGHLDILAAIEERLRRLPRLLLTGNSYRGVAVPDCLADGEAAARALLDPGADRGGPPGPS